MDWDRLPAGVRFDPSDEELLEHLAAKVGRSGTRPHPMLDEFIVPLVEEDGICRTHPENLPGKCLISWCSIGLDASPSGLLRFIEFVCLPHQCATPSLSRSS